MAFTAATRRRSRTTSSTCSSRSRTGSRCLRRRRTTSCTWTTRIPTRAARRRPGARVAGTTSMFERAGSTSTSTWLLRSGAVILLAGSFGVAMIYSTTYVDGGRRAGTPARKSMTQLSTRSALGLRRTRSSAWPSTTACSPSIRCSSTAHSSCCSSSCSSRGRRRWARSGGFRSGRSTCSPRSSRASPWRSSSPCTSARTAAARATRVISSSAASSRPFRCCSSPSSRTSAPP